MRFHKVALVGALAVAGIPAGAFAAKQSHPATPASTNANTHSTTTSTNAKSATAKVQFVLRGALSAYTPANGATNGSITLMVKASNLDSKTLKNTTLVLAVTSKTKVVLHDGAAIANGDRGTVKLRLAKNNSVWTGLTAGQVLDQGAPATA